MVVCVRIDTTNHEDIHFEEGTASFWEGRTLTSKIRVVSVCITDLVGLCHSLAFLFTLRVS